MLTDVADIARQAGAVILSIYRSKNFKVEYKTDLSPVTRADTEANQLILEGLRQISDLEVVSEETVREEGFSIKGGLSFWLVDPLDGTRNFIERQDSFVVNIALIENGEPTLGVIYAPVADELYTAEKGRGAFCNGQAISNRRVQQKDLTALASGHHPSPRSQQFYDDLGITQVIRYGSALKLARLARGDADLYPRFGPTYEWDIAAGDIILREAGGEILDMKTRAPMAYNKPGFLNQGFLAKRKNLRI